MDVKKIIDTIESENQGNQYYKVDLHIHTPASSDYDGEVSEEDIIDKAIEVGLDAIAITDHNSVEWCERVIKASKTKKITVFPGVEISCSGGKQGLHFIAIFDPKKPLCEIKDCLAKIGLDSKKQGNVDFVTRESIEKTLKKITDSNGIVIGAHAYSKKGLMGGITGKQRTNYIQDKNLRAIEITELNNLKYFDGNDKEYRRQLSCIKSSDAHSLGTIGSQFTLIKMAEPNLEGLRQAFFDPQSRIRFDPEQLHNHPSVIGMYIEGGFLDGQIFYFNENMNSLIGGKGTGKTTAIELIRFALYSSHKNDKLKEEFESMVKNVLGEGCVYLLVKSKDNLKYLIIRKVGEEPLIFKDDQTPFEIQIDNFHEFFDLECYSQGELICIARDSTNQIKMIDKYINFENFITDEKALLSKLTNNSTIILQNKEIINDLAIKIERLPSIIEKIRIIDEKGLNEFSEKQKRWEYEKSIINKFLKIMDSKISEIESNDFFKLDKLDVNETKITNNGFVKKFEEKYSDTEEEFAKYPEKLLGFLKTKQKELTQIHDSWNKSYNSQRAEFKKLCDELESKDIDVNNYLKLEEEKNTLNLNKEEVQKKTKENSKLLEERNQLLKRLMETRRNISEKRKKEIQKINFKLKDLLNITLDIETNNDRYSKWLIDCLRGSRLQISDTQFLCSKIKPSDLYQLIHDKKEDAADILSGKIGIRKSYFEKLLSHNTFMNKLFELQVIKLEDRLEIKLKENGWKSLNNLSTGGKCTAILLIAMLERNTPLLIDQPEDSLDNAFIYTSVVHILRKLKDIRQMIIVTHNANIPVLGDCELMFVMHSNGLNGDIRMRGVIDNKDIKERVQIILEGGEEAFKKRQEKYGI